MKVTITTNSKQVKDRFVRLKDNLPAAMEDSADIITDGFVSTLKSMAPVWTGQLKESIRKEKTGDGEYVIKMIKYGIVADTGRAPGFTPAIGKGFSKLQLWAGSKGIPYWTLRNWIRHHGTAPTNFINRAVGDLESSKMMNEIMQHGVRNAIRKSGIGLK